MAQAQVDSAWKDHPDYWIRTHRVRGRVRVLHGDLLLGETERALLVLEKDHAPRLYLPEQDVRLGALFEPTELHTVCPFKGVASYWTLSGSAPPLENVVWSYPTPFAEVGELAGHVCFYEDRVELEIDEPWSDGTRVIHRFPTWGDAADLMRLLDVEQNGPTRFTGATYHNVQRNVVEAGHQLAQSIVAASKTIPGKRVSFASMIFARAARFDEPLDLEVDVLRDGRSFSTVEVRASQEEKLCGVATLLMDVGAADVIRHEVPMPDVGSPWDAVPLDMGVLGRELRVVDAAYDPDPDRVGPPVIHTWTRFREAPPSPILHTALLTQSTTHWTIAAAMRPHAGIGESQAHRTLSTGIMAASLALHEEVDVTRWHLYSNPAIQAGGGLVQGEGHVFREDGRLVASYTVQGMVRAMPSRTSDSTDDPSTAM